MTKRIDKDSLPLNKPRRTPDHPTKSHVVKTKVDGVEKIIRFGEQGASTAGKPKAGESERMTAKRESFKARHASNIAKGPASAAYWANKVKWADGGSVRTNYAEGDSVSATPRKAALGKIADALKSAQEYSSQYEVSPQVPLLGGTGVDEMLSLPGAASLMDDISYHGIGALLRGGKTVNTFKVDPRIVDVADLAGTVIPITGALTKLAKKGIKAAVKKVASDEVVTPKEHKMLQGFYRGYAGQNPDTAELFITPQKRVADFYAEKRSSQIGGTPHAEMILIEQLTGNPYGHSTLGTGANPPMMTVARKIKADDIKGRTQLYATGGAVKVINKLAKVLMGGSDEAAVTAAQRAEAGRKAAALIKSQPQVKASEALGQLMEKGFKRTTTTQSDRTAVGGGNIGGAPFPAISEADVAYANKVWGVMDEGTAARLKNLTTPDTAWTTMLGSANQLKTNPIVFDKLKRQFLTSMKQGNLPPELEAKINHNLALTFGEGASIRDPGIWKQADTFEKRAALADLMMGQGIAPKKGGVALGGEKSGRGVIFRPTDTLIKETEPYLLHSEHGGDVPTFAAGPRLFTLEKESVYRPDLHPGFPTLITGKDLEYNVMPTPTEIYLRDWHAKFKRDNPERYPPFKTEKQAGPGYYDLALGVKGEGLPSQEITDEYIRHLIREGYAEGGPVGYGVGGLAKLAKKVLDKSSDVGLKIKPPSDNVVTVRQANFQYPKTIGNQTVSIDKISGGVRLSDPNEVKRVKALAKKIASPEGYISRIIVDHNNNVIEGQHRLEALRELGVKDVPVYKIEELADTMPVDKMEAAVQGVGAIHPDHVGQIVSHALEHISEEGIDGARQMNYGRFQKHYNAALDAIQSGSSPVIDRDANLANFLELSKMKQRLYHGTGSDISEFRPNSFFSDDPKIAGMYAKSQHRKVEGSGPNIIPVDVQLKNPFIFDENEARKQGKNFAEIIAPDASSKSRHSEALKILKEQGYDGVILKNFDDIGGRQNQYIVFEPAQVKSATGNQGTYDVNESDITKAKGGSVNMAEGGLVGDPVMAYDPLQVEEIMNSIDAPRGYAKGGKVKKEMSQVSDDPIGDFLNDYEMEKLQKKIAENEAALIDLTPVPTRVETGSDPMLLDVYPRRQREMEANPELYEYGTARLKDEGFIRPMLRNFEPDPTKEGFSKSEEDWLEYKLRPRGQSDFSDRSPPGMELLEDNKYYPRFGKRQPPRFKDKTPWDQYYAEGGTVQMAEGGDAETTARDLYAQIKRSGEAIDEGGLKYWTERAQSNQQSPEELQKAFMAAADVADDPYYEVNKMYQRINQTPDTEGFNYWVNRAQQEKLTPQQLGSQFIGGMPAITAAQERSGFGLGGQYGTYNGLPMLYAPEVDRAMDREQRVTGDLVNTDNAIGWDPSSISGELSRGAAAAGVYRTPFRMGGNTQAFQGDLVGTARQYGLNPEQYMKTSTGQYGQQSSALDENALYNALNDKMKDYYAVQGYVPPAGTENSAFNRTDIGGDHARVMYQRIGDRLVPIEDTLQYSNMQRAPKYSWTDYIAPAAIIAAPWALPYLSTIASAVNWGPIGTEVGKGALIGAGKSIIQGQNPITGAIQGGASGLIPSPFAEGGSVKAYDADRVDAIVNQFT